MNIFSDSGQCARLHVMEREDHACSPIWLSTPDLRTRWPKLLNIGISVNAPVCTAELASKAKTLRRILRGRHGDECLKLRPLALVKRSVEEERAVKELCLLEYNSLNRISIPPSMGG